MIQDSGERTQFESGAVRDMHQGKGRMDLLPMTAIIELSKHCEEGALKYGEHNVDKGIPQHSLCDSAMRHLVKYMRGDKDENHLRAACWNLMWALEQSVTKPELNDLYFNEIRIQVGDTFWELNRAGNGETYFYPRVAHSIQHVVYCMERLGKTTFLTEEAAKEAVAKLKGEEHE